jgi:hypothetical protein
VTRLAHFGRGALETGIVAVAAGAGPANLHEETIDAFFNLLEPLAGSGVAHLDAARRFADFLHEIA